MEALAWILIVSALAVLVSGRHVCYIGSDRNTQPGTPTLRFLTHENPCECFTIRLAGMTVSASPYSEARYYLDELILSSDPAEIQTYFDCTPRVPSSSPETSDRRDGATSDVPLVDPKDNFKLDDRDRREEEDSSDEDD